METEQESRNMANADFLGYAAKSEKILKVIAAPTDR
jgi:hypothetical protein